MNEIEKLEELINEIDIQTEELEAKAMEKIRKIQIKHEKKINEFNKQKTVMTEAINKLTEQRSL